MSWALSISLTHWRAFRITAHIFSFQCCGLRVCKEYLVFYFENTWSAWCCCLFLCRRVTIRVRGRITFGELRNLITAAKEKAPLDKSPLHKSTGSRRYSFVLGVSGHSFWSMLTKAMPWSFLFSSHPSLAPLRWFSLWIYTCVMYKNLTFLTTAEIQRGLFLHLWFQRLIFFSTWHHAQEKLSSTLTSAGH